MPAQRKPEKNISITGGAGFIGSRLADVSLGRGDPVGAFLLTHKHMHEVRRQVFNIGGGPANTTSLLELMNTIGELHGQAPEIRFANWRTADQEYYVADKRRFTRSTGWTPAVRVPQGVKDHYHWLLESRQVRVLTSTQCANRRWKLEVVSALAMCPKSLARQA
jgi:CDP-paratose 2-epimerase